MLFYATSKRALGLPAVLFLTCLPGCFSYGLITAAGRGNFSIVDPTSGTWPGFICLLMDLTANSCVRAWDPAVQTVNQIYSLRHFQMDGMNYFAGVRDIFRWNDSTALLDHFQAYGSEVSFASRPFSIGNETFIALAVSWEERNGNNFTLNSVIYRYDPVVSLFVPHQRILTYMASDWVAFSVNGAHYAMVSNAYDGNTYDKISNIYKWDPATRRFAFHQGIQTYGAHKIETLYLDTLYLFVANARTGVGGRTFNINSAIYKWSTSTASFALYQYIPTKKASDLQPCQSANGKVFLGIANSYDGVNRNIDSTIMQWQPSTGTFVNLQSYPTMSAAGWGCFVHQNETYLAVASNYDGIKLTGFAASDLLRYNAATGQFSAIQSIGTCEAEDWYPFTINDDAFTIVASDCRPINVYRFAKVQVLEWTSDFMTVYVAMGDSLLTPCLFTNPGSSLFQYQQALNAGFRFGVLIQASQVFLQCQFGISTLYFYSNGPVPSCPKSAVLYCGFNSSILEDRNSSPKWNFSVRIVDGQGKLSAEVQSVAAPLRLADRLRVEVIQILSIRGQSITFQCFGTGWYKEGLVLPVTFMWARDSCSTSNVSTSSFVATCNSSGPAPATITVKIIVGGQLVSAEVSSAALLSPSPSISASSSPTWSCTPTMAVTTTASRSVSFSPLPTVNASGNNGTTTQTKIPSPSSPTSAPFNGTSSISCSATLAPTVTSTATTSKILAALRDQRSQGVSAEVWLPYLGYAGVGTVVGIVGIVLLVKLRRNDYNKARLMNRLRHSARRAPEQMAVMNPIHVGGTGMVHRHHFPTDSELTHMPEFEKRSSSTPYIPASPAVAPVAVSHAERGELNCHPSEDPVVPEDW